MSLILKSLRLVIHSGIRLKIVLFIQLFISFLHTLKLWVWILAIFVSSVALLILIPAEINAEFYFFTSPNFFDDTIDFVDDKYSLLLLSIYSVASHYSMYAMPSGHFSRSFHLREVSPEHSPPLSTLPCAHICTHSSLNMAITSSGEMVLSLVNVAPLDLKATAQTERALMPSSIRVPSR